jgi:hypothetical protein
VLILQINESKRGEKIVIGCILAGIAYIRFANADKPLKPRRCHMNYLKISEAVQVPEVPALPRLDRRWNRRNLCSFRQR